MVVTGDGQRHQRGAREERAAARKPVEPPAGFRRCLRRDRHVLHHREDAGEGHEPELAERLPAERRGQPEQNIRRERDSPAGRHSGTGRKNNQHAPGEVVGENRETEERRPFLGPVRRGPHLPGLLQQAQMQVPAKGIDERHGGHRRHRPRAASGLGNRKSPLLKPLHQALRAEQQRDDRAPEELAVKLGPEPLHRQQRHQRPAAKGRVRAERVAGQAQEERQKNEGEPVRPEFIAEIQQQQHGRRGQQKRPPRLSAHGVQNRRHAQERQDQTQGDQPGPARGLVQQEEKDFAQPVLVEVRRAGNREGEHVGADQPALLHDEPPIRQLPPDVAGHGDVPAQNENHRGREDGQRGIGHAICSRCRLDVHGRSPSRHATGLDLPFSRYRVHSTVLRTPCTSPTDVTST